MHKGEIVAVSPKGRGMHPDNFMVLLKNENNEDWLPVDDDLDFKKIKKGMCEFELTNENSVKTIINESKQNQSTLKSPEAISKGHTSSLKQLDITQLSMEINKLNELRKVAATQVFPLKSSGKQLYDALVYFRSQK